MGCLKWFVVAVCSVVAFGSVSANSVVPETDAREMVRVKSEHALKLAEVCFQKAYLMLSIFEMKQKGISEGEARRRLRSAGIGEEQASDLFISLGHGMVSANDQAIVQEYDACIEQQRPKLKIDR